MLSPTTGYAAMALALLSRAKGGAVRVRHLADRCGIPGPYLSKIIHTLARHNLVGTRRGVGGGVWLIKPPDNITLLDLCRVLDDPVLDRNCPLGLPPCMHGRTCIEPGFCDPQRRRLAEYLQVTTVAGLADKFFGPQDSPDQDRDRPEQPLPTPTSPRVIPADLFGEDEQNKP